MIIAGLILLVVAGEQAYKGITRKFLEQSKTEQMSEGTEKAFTVLGVVGHLARTVVFGLVGYFLIKSAIDYKPKEAVGLDGALTALQKAAVRAGPARDRRGRADRVRGVLDRRRALSQGVARAGSVRTGHVTDAEQLAARTAADPHSYLGAHPDGDGGVVVRAFRPAARAVHVLLAGGARADLAAVGPEGVFEGRIDGASLPLDYELEVEYADDRTYTVGDPYRFLPTLGDVDLHLVGEGRHEELYEKLGAHVIEHQGVGGTAFAVWAPSARAVSVVGDFNSWDGRLHPMRSLGSSGVWELFLPGVGAGTNYKYEILAASGELRLKADPVAFATELPPKTASVVFDPEHEWGDDGLGRPAQGDRPAQASRSRSTRSTSARGG